MHLCNGERSLSKEMEIVVSMWRKLNRSTKPMSRPVKSACERKRRLKVQKKRLVALDVSADVVRRMNSSEVRAMLKKPAKLAKSARK